MQLPFYRACREYYSRDRSSGGERAECVRERLRNFLVGTANTSRYRLVTALVNRALTCFNLSKNGIDAEGAKAVAAVLPQCKYVA